MSEKPYTFILIGPSGCGKGTQAKRLSNWLEQKPGKIVRLETGNRLRSFIETNSFTAKKANEMNELGSLQPEFLAVWTWASELVEKYEEDCHLIIDGTPRRRHEASVLHSAMEFYKRERPIVIFLNLDSALARERLLLRHRADDNDEDIRKRLMWYESEVLPAIEYYRNHEGYNFFEIDASSDEEGVWKSIEDKISSL